MTHHHIELVRADWERIAPIVDKVAIRLHQRLDSITPIHPSSPAETPPPEFGALLHAVASPRDAGALLSEVASLFRAITRDTPETRRHVSVGTALMVVLEEFLGEDFTTAHREAWVEAYGALVELLQDASARAA